MALRCLAVGVLGSALLLACNKETPPAAEEPRSPSNAVAPQAAAANADGAVAAGPSADAAPATSGAPTFSDPAFDLSIAAKSPFKAGQAGALEVVLVAKAPFHVNDKYPIKLKLKETPGLKYDNLVVGKDAVKLEPMKAVMPVTVTPDGAGPRTVAGQLAFSVCTEDKCLMEKRDLQLVVSVD